MDELPTIHHKKGVHNSHHKKGVHNSHSMDVFLLLRLGFLMSRASGLLVFTFSFYIHFVMSSIIAKNLSVSLTHSLFHGSSIRVDGFPVSIQASLLVGTPSFYFVRLGVGTPSRSYLFVMDTGSSLTWIQHNSCTNCIKQDDKPLFGHPDYLSSSYSVIKFHDAKCGTISSQKGENGNCPYEIVYGGVAGSTIGVLVTETLAVGDGSFRDHVMGSGTDNVGNHGGAAGIFALNQAPSSFPRQMGITYFSYCLHATTSIEFGGLEFGGTIPSGVSKFDLSAPPDGDFSYYIPLYGIRVDEEKLEIDPVNFKMDHINLEGGIILDTGTHTTHLSPYIYEKLHKAFHEKIQNNIPTVIEFKLSIGLQCYKIANVDDIPKVPSVYFHLGEGENEIIWPIPFNGVLFQISDDAYCFAFQEMVSSFEPQIIGNLAQQKTKFYFDLKDQKLGVSLLAC